jgi:protein-disulfide isomerase
MYRFQFRRIAFVCLSVLFIVLFASPLPSLAATRISPQLEQQVLQILKDHPEVLIQSVQAYQQQQNQAVQQAQQAFLQNLQTNPQQVIGDSPIFGNAESKTVLVEFSDFECPYCADAHKTLKQFLAKHPNEVALTYKHFPLTPIHSQARPSALAAWAANQQGKFWEYHDALFTQQDKLGEALYVEIAEKLNLDLEKFQSDRTSEAANNAIIKDVQLAQSLGISGTPFFVLNGQTFSGAVKLADIEKILLAKNPTP